MSPSQSSSASQSSSSSLATQQSSAEPLSISQALLITAGMAGLIGLISGTLIRFSFANSSHARFLSPLQTFPASASWTPSPSSQTSTNPTDLPLAADDNSINTIDSVPPQSDTTFAPDFEPRKPIELTSEGFLRRESVETARDRTDDIDMSSAPITTFDAFSNRNSAGRQVGNPLEKLRQGPALGRRTSEDNGSKALAEDDFEVNNDGYITTEDDVED